MLPREAAGTSGAGFGLGLVDGGTGLGGVMSSAADLPSLESFAFFADFLTAFLAFFAAGFLAAFFVFLPAFFDFFATDFLARFLDAAAAVFFAFFFFEDFVFLATTNSFYRFQTGVLRAIRLSACRFCE